MSSEGRDFDLPTDDEREHLTALGLIASCRKEWEESALKYLATAEYNERMISGDQFVSLSENYEISDLEWSDSVPRVRRNLLSNLALTWAARMLEDRPRVQCWPARPGAAEAAAQVASQVLDYQMQAGDFDDLCFTAAMLVQMHSVVGFKAVWDPRRGPASPGYAMGDDATQLPILDGDGNPRLFGVGEPEGEVSWQLVTVFDFGMPPQTERIEDAKWCFFKSYVAPHEARRILREKGIDADVSEKQHETIWGLRDRGVECIEYWHVPCPRFPKGLFISTCSGHVVELQAFPYHHGELPLSLWKCRARRNSCFGATHVDDAVPIQIAINEDASSIRRQVREISSIKLLIPSSIAADLEHGNQVLKLDHPDLMAQVRYVDPPDVANVLKSSLDDNVRALYDVFGLSEQLTGASSVGSATAAKAIAYLTKLDSMKTSGASRSLGTMIQRLCRQTLKLVQQYVVRERLLQIAGQSGGWEVLQFQGSDIDGVDVRLEPASGMARYRATVAQAAQDQMTATGQSTPALQHQAQTGLEQQPDEALMRDLLEQQMQAAMRGEQVQPDPRVSPQLAYETLSQVLSGVPQGPLSSSLWALLQAYQAQAQQAQQPPQQPPQGAPQ